MTAGAEIRYWSRADLRFNRMRAHTGHHRQNSFLPDAQTGCGRQSIECPN